jgi:nucleoside-diphosphate-sugar epimerase
LNVLLTGASGRLGANVMALLLERGYDVRALVIPDDPRAGKLAPFDVEIMKGDLRDPSTSRRALDGVDAVIHTANILGPPPGMLNEQFFAINVAGTFHLLEEAGRRASQLERFVHISSDAVYPMGNHNPVSPAYQPIDELHPKRPVGLYPMCKLLNEVQVETMARSTGLRTSMIRPAGMFAGKEILQRWTVRMVVRLLTQAMRHPHSELHHPDNERAIADLRAQATHEDQYVDVRGPNGQPWIYTPADARDVAGGAVAALEHPAAVGETFNIAVPRPFPFGEVAGYLAERTGEPYVTFEAPVRWVYWSDTRKVRRLIDFTPRCDLPVVFDTALADARGEATSVIPA